VASSADVTEARSAALSADDEGGGKGRFVPVAGGLPPLALLLLLLRWEAKFRGVG